jgi:hypothetical protein
MLRRFFSPFSPSGCETVAVVLFVSAMTQMLTRKVRRAPFEFELDGPRAHKPGGHQPDFLLSVLKNSAQAGTRSPAATLSVPSGRHITLDSLFIVDILGAVDFGSITEIDCSSRRLNAVDFTVLRDLSAVKKADFSDNKLPLEPFAVMRALEELDLSCNSLKSFDHKASESMAGDSRAWSCLVILNLAYNFSSKMLTGLQLIPRLTKLNLSFNSLTSLPSSLMHFTCLSHLDLSGNKLNSDPDFFSLATIPALQTLILNENNIFRVPKFQFGFEVLMHLSLDRNKIEYPDDIASLTDLEQLQDVSILGNPILLRVRYLKSARVAFAAANIALNCDDAPPPVKHSIVGPLRTVRFDPLVLPSFTKAHIRALNRKVHRTSESPTTSPDKPAADTVFMTSFASKTEEDEERRTQIEPTPLPEPEAPPIVSVWDEVPVVQFDRRIGLMPSRRQDFVMSFRKLEYLVAHPEIRLKPQVSTCLEPEYQTVSASLPNLIVGKEAPEPPGTTKPSVATQLAARTEYTKAEIEGMLRSMEERLGVVERDLLISDESGQTAVDIALDQRNFAALHKQYEQIRAELINTLNS